VHLIDVEQFIVKNASFNYKKLTDCSSKFPGILVGNSRWPWPAGMGMGKHLPLEMLYFCAANVSKVSVDEVFMHYFKKMLSASGGFAPIPRASPQIFTGALPLDSAGKTDHLTNTK